MNMTNSDFVEIEVVQVLSNMPESNNRSTIVKRVAMEVVCDILNSNPLIARPHGYGYDYDRGFQAAMDTVKENIVKYFRTELQKAAD